MEVPDNLVVTQKMIALLLGVTTTTIRRWDCPRTADRRYHIPSVVAWRVRVEQEKLDDGAPARTSAATLQDDDDRARWQRAKADILEMERDERRARLLDADQVGQFWRDRIIAARTALMALGSGLAEELASESDPSIVRDTIDLYLRRVCDGLAREYEANVGDDEDSGAEAEVPQT